MNARVSEQHSLVYPVQSRRSGGLSLGIDLFPDRKHCSFDCPYCEVHPFNHHEGFSAGRLERELDEFLSAWHLGGDEPVRDLCIAGHGEPTLSPRLGEALSIIARAREKFWPGDGRPQLVVITNATMLGDERLAALLSRYVEEEALVPWVKLDAGSQELFEAMSGTALKLADIVEGIAGFASSSPTVIQTMLCELDGAVPREEDLDDYSRLLGSILGRGAKLVRIDLYTQSRPAPIQRTRTLPRAWMERARDRIAAALSPVPVRVFF